MKRATLVLAALALVIGGVGRANASFYTVASDLQGWVNNEGHGNGAAQGNNTFTGDEGDFLYNSWASFTLPTFSETVIAATLKLNLGNWPSGSQTPYAVSIYDVNTPLASFVSGTSGTAGYDDLGSGNFYGTTTSPGVVSVNLSAQAVTDITTDSGGTFIVGFTNATLIGQNPNGVDAGFYNNSGATPQLVVDTAATVPEPSALILLSVGAVGLAGCGWRKRQRPMPA